MTGLHQQVIVTDPAGTEITIEVPGTYQTPCPRCRTLAVDRWPPAARDAYLLARCRYFVCGLCGLEFEVEITALGDSDA